MNALSLTSIICRMVLSYIALAMAISLIPDLTSRDGGMSLHPVLLGKQIKMGLKAIQAILEM
jgi:hypothetical protein